MKSLVLILSVFVMAACGGPKAPPVPVNGEYFKGDSVNFVKYVNKNGIVVSEMPFVNNRADGLAKEYYDNGKLRLSVEFVDAKRQGMTTSYYETGEKHSETPYVNGKIEGVKHMFKKDGSLTLEVSYKAGRPMPGIKEYDAEGKLLPQPTLKLTPKGGTLEMTLVGAPYNSVSFFQVQDGQLQDIPLAGEAGQLAGAKRGTIIYAEYVTSRGEKAGLESKY